ncbi:trehalase isoform X2 [Aethina tumida]|nr:trehalase isoform X2 [Aethina tumida]
MAKIYEDSKTFVDMKLKKSPNETLQTFNKWIKQFGGSKPSKMEVTKFVRDNFEDAGQEFEVWNPSDWVEHPRFLDSVTDEKFKQWARKLNKIWKTLGRKMKSHVQQNPDLYSIIWVPNPVIVPGGRFREFYYWDTYWIIQGLLLSDMHDTVKGILENFLYIVDTYGHIPNGGRIYYLARSQPPLMIPMIKLYWEYTHDREFIRNNIHTMEKEFQFWMDRHLRTVTKNGKTYKLAVYADRSKGPRPESYSEDIESANIFKDQNKKDAFYSELKAAAESGWDFSSRWFITNATNKGNLTNTKTRSIVPVELNSFIYWNADILTEFFTELGNETSAKRYRNISKTWLEAVEAVLWHEEVGAWLDYDLYNGVKRDYFYPTNISPLLTGCFNKVGIEKRTKLIMKYLQNKNIMNYPGGIPSTVEHTGEQWDYPNAWPPLQHMMIVALNNTGDSSAERLAFEIAEKWIRSNYRAYEESDAMYEKYDATVMGGHGGGGEYELQIGFGWTNGVVMDLLYKYSSKLTPHDPVLSNKADTVVAATTSSPLVTALVALVVSLTAGFIGVCIYKNRSRQQTLLYKNKKQYKPSSAHYTELRNIPEYSKSLRKQVGLSRGSKSP